MWYHLRVDSETRLDDVVVNCPRCGRRTLPRPSVLPELRRYCVACGDWRIDGITGRLHMEHPRNIARPSPPAGVIAPHRLTLV
jgi:hypothetical protein